jgi:SAM-dependent methyltransferase
MSQQDPAMVTAPFEPDRFRSTVAYYVAYRLRYPAELLQLVLQRLALGPGARVLDLGCGPGFLANGFAALGCTAIGLDPSTDMLAAAREESTKHAVTVDYRQGSSYDLDGLAERFDLAVMGRSFHWMDRPQTLRSLDRLVTPHGGVVLFYDQHIRCNENAFDSVLEKMRETYGERNTIHAARKSKKLMPDESIFMDSSFSHLLRLCLVQRRPVTADQVVGRAFSLSLTSPEKLGERAPAFEAELRRRLSEVQPDGKFTELVEFNALIGTRHAGNGG